MVLENLTEDLHIRVSKRTMQALQRLHKRTGASVSYIVRYAINDYCSRKGAFIKCKEKSY